MNGYIKLHRSIADWEWFKDDTTLKLFIACLCLANWDDVRYKGDIIPKGSFVTTLPKLADYTGLTISQIRTSTEKLKSTGEITVKATNKNRLITVIKWGEYQYKNGKNRRQDSRQIADKSQTNRRHPIEEEIKEEKERKIYRKRSDDIIPIYDPSGNPKVDEAKIRELMERRGK